MARWEQGKGRRRRDARTAEEEPNRGRHFISLCDLNSNRLMAKAACRCKRPRKRRVKRRDLKKKRKGGGVKPKGTKCSRDTLTHFDSTIGSGCLIDHITSRQHIPDTQNTFQTKAHNEDLLFILGLQLTIIIDQLFSLLTHWLALWV